MNLEELNLLKPEDVVYYLGKKVIVENVFHLAVIVVEDKTNNSITINEYNVDKFFIVTSEIEKIAHFFVSTISFFTKNKPSNVNPAIEQKINDFWVELAKIGNTSSSAYVDIRHDFVQFMQAVDKLFFVSVLELPLFALVE